MNDKITSLTAIQYSSMILGISMTQIESILSVILIVISIVVGLLNLVLLLRKVFADKKIDDDEIKEITAHLNNLQETISTVIKGDINDGKHD